MQNQHQQQHHTNQETHRVEMPDLVPALATGASFMLAQSHENASVKREEIRAKLQQREKSQDIKLKLAQQQFELEREKLLTPDERQSRWFYEQEVEQKHEEFRVRETIRKLLLQYSSCRNSAWTCHTVADHLEVELTELVGNRYPDKLPSLVEFFNSHRMRCAQGTQIQHVREWLSTNLYVLQSKL